MMKSKNVQIMYTAAFIACMAVFFYCVSDKLSGGARWSSGLPLGGVDNWLDKGGSLYTVEENGITPGSSYFPGIVLLALLFRFLFGYRAETAIILTGGIIAVLIFGGFSIIASDDRKERFILAVVSAMIFVIEFPKAQSYLLEMHPDIPALMCFAWGIISLNKYLEKHKHQHLIYALLAFWGAGLFKQNAVSLYLGLGVYVMCSKTFTMKEKINILMCEFFAGIATLTVVLLIKGCWYNCVTVNSLHPLMSIGKYLKFALATCKDNIFFVFIAFIYCVLLLTKNIVIERRIERMWLASSLGWLVFCMYGASKEGANSGNMEAAIITVMPFVLIILSRVWNYTIECVNVSKIKKDLNTMKSHKAVKCMILGAIIVTYAGFLILISCLIFNQLETYHERLEVQNEFSEWLSENYGGKNVAYNSITYEILNNADINKTTDFCTVDLWGLGGIINDDDLNRLSTEESWDLIITWPGCDDAIWPETFRAFEKIDENKYPNMSKYYGSNVEVFVKSNE